MLIGPPRHQHFSAFDYIHVFFLYTVGKYENIVEAFVDIALLLILFVVIGVIVFIPIPIILCIRWKYKKGMVIRKL